MTWAKRFLGLLAFLLVLWLLWFQSQLKKIEVVNQISGHNFSVSKLATNLYLLSQSYSQDIDITVVYTNEVQTGAKFYSGSFGDESNLISSVGSKRVDSNLTISAHYDENAISQIISQPGRLDKDLLAYLCLVIDPAKPTVEQCYQKVNNYMEKFGKFIPVNVVKIKNKISWRLVSEVFAQSCSGTISCGEEISYSFCSNSSYNYLCNAGNTGSACGPGTCYTGSYCEESLNDLNCGSLSSQNLCENATAGNSCNPPFCNNSADNSCNWGGGGGGGACGASSAGSCQGKNVGEPCNNGTCQNAPNCSCQGGGGGVAGCNGTSTSCTVPGGACNTYLTASSGKSPLYPTRCGTDSDYDPPLNRYWMCCGCTSSNPGTPALTAPANSATVNPGLVRLDWSAISNWGVGCPENTNRYRVYANKNNNPPGTQVTQTTASTTQYDYSASSTGTYYWYIQAHNGTRSTNSVIRTFIVANPSCTVSLAPDPASILQGIDQQFTATAIPSNGTVSEVRFTSSNTAAATVLPASDTSSQYQTSASGIAEGTSTITAQVYMAGVQRCSDTAALTVTAPPAASTTPWFQTLGGSSWASGNIQSNIPATTCLAPACKSALILRDALGTTDSAGFPLTNTGSIITSASGGIYIHETDGRSNALQAGALGVQVPVENYDYFLGKFGEQAELLPNANKPIVGNELAVYRYNGNLTIDDTNPWHLANTEQIVVFVSGNLTIDDAASGQNRLTSVASGGDGFLMFVVNGDMTVSADVGYNDIYTNPAAANIANVEGVFIADGILTIAGQTGVTDRKFIGAGTFVGWSGVSLERDFDNGSSPELNNDAATEVFIFRPDFIVNAPREVKSAQMTWREVEPSF